MDEWIFYVGKISVGRRNCHLERFSDGDEGIVPRSENGLKHEKRQAQKKPVRRNAGQAFDHFTNAYS
ncbi:hypothetical protein K9857_12105 [Pseudomonas sp. REP124]|uniref:hypothetical protein n=1 Tax=Pseudomonas sp. REP124 TaxID=2875731 RepID=UPI001CCC361F|nr:hypothetical protein [Pseudomonas sp. REP124]MBZ9782281.1 hypothetical protein [Pseudomonas sp. REP124]